MYEDERLFYYARVVERNTQQVQILPCESACGFKSRLSYVGVSERNRSVTKDHVGGSLVVGSNPTAHTPDYPRGRGN